MAQIVNLFGGPGAGKSTMRASLFSRLKKAGVNVEEVIEIAKGFVWESRHETLNYQPYIFGKQLRDIERVMNKVDLIITDSPILMCSYYAKHSKYPSTFHYFVWDHFRSMPGMNYLITRSHPYSTAGRYQTEEDADVVAKEIEEMLNTLQIPYLKYPSGPATEDIIMGQILANI